MVTEGRLYRSLFQCHLREHWKFPQLLETLLPWSDYVDSSEILAQSSKCPKKSRDPRKRPQHLTLYRCLKRLGYLLVTKQYQLLVDFQESKLHINVLKVKSVFLALKKFQLQCQHHLIIVATDNNFGLHKQTRKSPLN